MKLALAGLAAALSLAFDTQCEGNVTVKPVVGDTLVEQQAATLMQVAELPGGNIEVYRYDDSVRLVSCWITSSRGAITCLKMH